MYRAISQETPEEMARKVALYRAEGYTKFQLKLPAGYVPRMPVAGWYTSHGECIEGKGVEPDVLVENTPESLTAGVDTQLEKALELINRV